MPRVRWTMLAGGAPLWTAVAVVFAIAVGIRSWDPGPVQRARLSLFDQWQRLSPRVPDPDAPVRIVAIDDSALTRFGSWPWSRSRLAELVTRLEEAGARTITIDAIFVEQDRFAPQSFSRAFLQNETINSAIPRLPNFQSGDDLLAAALTRTSASLALVGDDRGASSLPPPKGRVEGPDAGARPGAMPTYTGGVMPLTSFARGAAGLGAANRDPDIDGVVRRLPMLVAIAGQVYPALPLETMRVSQHDARLAVHARGRDAAGITAVVLGRWVLPTDADGSLWLKFAPTPHTRMIPAGDVLDRKESSEIIDRHVIIGATAKGLADIRSTPLGSSVPGVEIEAQALEQILAADFLIRPAFAALLEVAVTLVATAVLVGLCRRLRVATLGATAVAVTLLFAASWLAYRYVGLLIDPTWPAATTAAIGLLAVLSAGASRLKAHAR